MSQHQNPNKIPRSSQWKSTLVIGALYLIVFSPFLISTSSPKSQPYSKFISLVESGRVERVIISSNRLKYTLKSEGFEDNSEQVFTTVPVTQDTELPKILRQHQVEFSAIPSNSGSGFWVFLQLLFFLFLLVNLGGLLYNRRQQGGASPFAVGRSNARIYSKGSMDVTFDNVAGVDEAKTELFDILPSTSRGIL